MPLDLDKALAELRAMTVKELQVEYHQVWGEETRSHSKPHLIRRIAWKLQAIEEGFAGHPEEVLQRARELADLSFLRTRPPADLITNGRLKGNRTRSASINPDRDPRLPKPGTVLTRRHKGRLLRCTVLEDGFEFAGETYTSLSAAAKAASGSHTNGFRFWGLTGKAKS